MAGSGIGRSVFLAAVLCGLATSTLSHHREKSVNGLSTTVPPVDDLKTLVQKFFDKALKVVVNNDPFQIEEVDLNYNSYGIESKGYMKSMLLAFMSSIKISYLDVEQSRDTIDFGLRVSMDQFQFTGTTDIVFHYLTFFPLDISGKIGILLSGIDISLDSSIKETENNILQFSNFNINLNLNGSKVEIEELNRKKPLGTYVAHILSDVLTTAVNENTQLFKLFSIGLKSLLNPLLANNDVTLAKVEDFIVHFIQ